MEGLFPGSPQVKIKGMSSPLYKNGSVQSRLWYCRFPIPSAPDTEGWQFFRFSSGSNSDSQLTNCLVLKCESIYIEIYREHLYYKIEHQVARFPSCSNRNITWYWMISVQWRRVFSGTALFEGKFFSYKKSEGSMMPEKQNRVCGERERERGA